jgi:hypothetical protein
MERPTFVIGCQESVMLTIVKSSSSGRHLVANRGYPITATEFETISLI